MAEIQENKFENENKCYRELIDSINRAKMYASESGEKLLESIGNFAKLYLDYFKRVVNSGTGFSNNTYQVFDLATQRDFLLLSEGHMIDEEYKTVLSEVKSSIRKFYNSVEPPKTKDDKGIGKK